MMGFSQRAKVLPLALALVLSASASRAQFFSAAPGGGSGLSADDIYFAPPPSGPPAPVLLGAGANVDAIALGRFATIFSLAHVLEFSVSPASLGLPGSAVFLEAIGGVGGALDHPADIFSDFVVGSNAQVVDGDALPNPLFSGLSFGLIEPFPTPGDNVDGWDNQPSAPFGGLWFSIDPALAPGLTSPADIYFWFLGGPPPYDTSPPAVTYVPAFIMGLDISGVGTDDIDALVFFEDEFFGFTMGDIILFSLAPGSAAFTNGSPYSGFGPADVFMFSSAGPAIYRTAADMGLAPTDNIDALDINSELFVIPEPASAGLLLLGLAAFSLHRIRRR